MDKRFVFERWKLRIRIRSFCYTFNYPWWHLNWHVKLWPNFDISKLGHVYTFQVQWLSWEWLNVQWEFEDGTNTMINHLKS